MTTSTEVFLHVGTMKSGTSYIQTVLRRNQDALEAAGVLTMTRLLGAVGDIRGREGKAWPREFKGQWTTMMNRIDAWPGDKAVLSQEFLASSTLDEAQAVIAGLGDRRITVIITARDLLRNIPSQWQTGVRSNSTMSFATFVEAVLAPPDDGGNKMSEGFWRNHDLARITETWVTAAGADNVVLITLPPPGGPRERLWTHFATVVGIDPLGYDAEPDSNANVSLSYSEVEMLRAVNKKLRGSIDALEYRRLVWRYLASKLLQKGRVKDAPSDRPQISAATHDAVVKRVDEMLAELRTFDVHVLGDIEDLRVPPYSGPADADERATPEQPVPTIATFVISRLLVRIADLERQLAAATSPEQASADPDAEAEQGSRREGKRKRKRKQRKGKPATDGSPSPRPTP